MARIDKRRIKDKSCPYCGALIARVSKTCKKCFFKNEETKEKHRKSIVGKKKTITQKVLKKWDEQKGKPAWNKGKKTGAIPWNKGKTMSVEYCETMRKAWEKKREGKPAVSPLRKLKRMRIEYKTWRITVWKRDNFICRKCGVAGKKLHTHHIASFLEHEHLRYDVENGLTLCSDCHYLLHSIYGKTPKGVDYINNFMENE